MNSHCNECQGTPDNIGLAYGLVAVVAISRPFNKHGLTLILPWISEHMSSKVWDEITYPFLNFNGTTVEKLQRYNRCSLGTDK